MKKEIITLLFLYLFTFSVYSQCTPPEPVSPENGSTVNTLTPTLCWSDGYNFSPAVILQISAEPSFNYPFYQVDLFQWPGCHTINPGALTYNHWYWWRIRVNCYPGYPGYSTVYSFQTAITGINKISSEVPENFSLSQNYPNPFNPTTKIKFQIPAVGQRHAFDTKLIIYDLLGREVEVLVNEQLSPGTYEAEWNAANFASGVYFYQLKISDASAPLSITKKMVLLK